MPKGIYTRTPEMKTGKYIRKPETRKKLSDIRYKLTKRGKESNFWKGGNSRSYKTGYYSPDYKQWRIGVFERDGYKCQGCGIIGTYLTAHHIKSFAHYPELRFELTNGITLCEECHKLTDNYKGRACKKKKKK